MTRPRKNAPHRRPKHERRTKNTRQTPHSHYTNRTRGKRPDTVIFDEMHQPAPPAKGFDMPPEDAEPSTGKVVAQVCAFVFGGLALLYAITWIYGHFRWGW